MADARVAELRDALYSVAGCALAAHRATKAETSEALDAMNPDDRMEIEERAAILEFDAGLTRDQAERLALSRYNSRIPRTN